MSCWNAAPQMESSKWEKVSFLIGLVNFYVSGVFGAAMFDQPNHMLSLIMT